jgi:uncharacterized protein (TIGR02996 family)
MTTEQNALLAAIRANPADRTARLVYADWLDEHADPLGPYVRAEAELASRQPGSREWEASIGRLLECCSTADRAFGGWEYDSDLMRIRKKIDRLRAIDPQMEVFGARWGTDGHEYRLDPPLREPDLLAFELRHGIALPAEYRAFLLRVGNGRVGPSYGLIPLDITHDYLELRKSFPMTEELANTIADVVKEAREKKRKWSDIPQPKGTWRSGYLELSDHGCGNSSLLIVNGQLRDQMWHSGTFGHTPDRTKSGESLGFLAWYEGWLDHCLAPSAIERRANRAQN